MKRIEDRNDLSTAVNMPVSILRHLKGSKQWEKTIHRVPFILHKKIISQGKKLLTSPVRYSRLSRRCLTDFHTDRQLLQKNS